MLFRYRLPFFPDIAEYRKTTFLILLILCILWISKNIGLWTKTLFMKILGRIGEIPIFQITKGDMANLDKIAQKNSNSRAKLIRNSLLEFLIGFLASLTVWFLTKN
jgi:hypothetical protein